MTSLNRIFTMASCSIFLLSFFSPAKANIYVFEKRFPIDTTGLYQTCEFKEKDSLHYKLISLTCTSHGDQAATFAKSMRTSYHLLEFASIEGFGKIYCRDMIPPNSYFKLENGDTVNINLNVLSLVYRYITGEHTWLNKRFIVRTHNTLSSPDGLKHWDALSTSNYDTSYWTPKRIAIVKTPAFLKENIGINYTLTKDSEGFAVLRLTVYTGNDLIKTFDIK